MRNGDVLGVKLCRKVVETNTPSTSLYLSGYIQELKPLVRKRKFDHLMKENESLKCNGDVF